MVRIWQLRHIFVYNFAYLHIIFVRNLLIDRIQSFTAQCIGTIRGPYLFCTTDKRYRDASGLRLNRIVQERWPLHFWKKVVLANLLKNPCTLYSFDKDKYMFGKVWCEKCVITLKRWEIVYCTYSALGHNLGEHFVNTFPKSIQQGFYFVNQKWSFVGKYIIKAYTSIYWTQCMKYFDQEETEKG